MDGLIHQGAITVTAGEALEAHRFVKYSAAGSGSAPLITVVYADADEEALGVTTRAAENGDIVSVTLLAAGVLKVAAGAAISAGADCYNGADGKLAASGAGSKYKALQAAAADGDLIQVLAPANFANA